MLILINMYKKVVTSTVVLLCIWFVAAACVSPAAYASTRDEAAMGRAGQAIDDLWGFVDDSGKLDDNQFYEEFVRRTGDTEEVVGDTYRELAATSENGRAGEAIRAIRNDVGTMESQLHEWQNAAAQKDASAFETANGNLADTVDLYNSHIDAYNAAKNGGRSVYDIIRYAIGPAISFALCSFLLAWAIYYNQKQDDVVKELQRRLRWQGVRSAAGILVGTAVPAWLFFFTDVIVPPWVWFLSLPGLAALLFTGYRYLKVIFLVRRRS
jgi:hypothetical protein